MTNLVKRIMYLVLNGAITAMIFLSVSAIAAELTVTYPNFYGLGTNGFGYQMLELALKKSGQPYKLSIDGGLVNQDRAREGVKTGVYSVIDFGIGPEIENELEPIYIPIDRGLTGWRVFIINKSQITDFSKIDTLEKLKSKRAGQGMGWADVAILENAGINVITSAQFPYLFRMVGAGRFDFLPLGVNEVHGLLDQFRGDSADLVVENHIVLAYPFGRLFFVKKGNTILHDVLQNGLEKAFSDGSFQKLVESHPYYRDGLAKSNLKSRAIINIDNPFMSEGFRKIDAKWFFKPL